MRKQLEPIHPGEILREEFLTPLGISINRLAREISVSPARVSDIVNGRRGISADTALRLGRFLACRRSFGLVCSRTTTYAWRGRKQDRKSSSASTRTRPEANRNRA